MAIIRELNKVENAQLHDAILLATLIDNNKYKFDKLYVDPNRECAVYFKGLLSYKDMQSFFFNLRNNSAFLFTIFKCFFVLQFTVFFFLIGLK